MTERKVALVTGSGKSTSATPSPRRWRPGDYALVIHYHTSATEAAETAEELSRAHGIATLTIRATSATNGRSRRWWPRRWRSSAASTYW